MILRLSRTLAQAIQSEMETAGHHECCGLLLGDRAALRVEATLAAANVAADPLHRFEIDPAVLFAAHKAARAGGPQIVGHYHSHPGGEPVPSSTDAAMAQGDGEIWLIVGKNGVIRAWCARSQGTVQGRFDPLEIVIPVESSLAPTSRARH